MLEGKGQHPVGCSDFDKVGGTEAERMNGPWLRGWDSNPQPQGYEPCELPIALPRGKLLGNYNVFMVFLQPYLGNYKPPKLRIEGRSISLEADAD